MSRKIRLSPRRLFPPVLFLLLPLLLVACGRWTFEILPPSTPAKPTASRPGSLVISKNLTFTAAIPELGTKDRERQSINLDGIERPGRYILQLANDNTPFSGHWIEWDYLALEAGDRFVWRIGQDETPPVYGPQAADEFCGTVEHTDCRTGFEIIAGKIDERSFPKTLNDGAFPVITIVFTVAPEQTGADLALTLSTLYSSHLPDTRDFRMQMTLHGPF